jgi:hypothetical protein
VRICSTRCAPFFASALADRLESFRRRSTTRNPKKDKGNRTCGRSPCCRGQSHPRDIAADRLYGKPANLRSRKRARRTLRLCQHGPAANRLALSGSNRVSPGTTWQTIGARSSKRTNCVPTLMCSRWQSPYALSATIELSESRKFPLSLVEELQERSHKVRGQQPTVNCCVRPTG